MPVIVVDASAVCALLFREPKGALVAPRLSGVTLAAPNLLPFEVANVCVTKIRRSSADRNSLMALFALLPAMNITLAEVDHAEVLTLAVSSGLTAYDASYLWLAQAMAAELVTLDVALGAAWANLQRSSAQRP